MAVIRKLGCNDKFGFNIYSYFDICPVQFSKLMIDIDSLPSIVFKQKDTNVTCGR